MSRPCPMIKMSDERAIKKWKDITSVLNTYRRGEVARLAKLNDRLDKIFFSPCIASEADQKRWRDYLQNQMTISACLHVAQRQMLNDLFYFNMDDRSQQPNINESLAKYSAVTMRLSSSRTETSMTTNINSRDNSTGFLFNMTMIANAHNLTLESVGLNQVKGGVMMNNNNDNANPNINARTGRGSNVKVATPARKQPTSVSSSSSSSTSSTTATATAVPGHPKATTPARGRVTPVKPANALRITNKTAADKIGMATKNPSKKKAASGDLVPGVSVKRKRDDNTISSNNKADVKALNAKRQRKANTDASATTGHPDVEGKDEVHLVSNPNNTNTNTVPVIPRRRRASSRAHSVDDDHDDDKHMSTDDEGDDDEFGHHLSNDRGGGLGIGGIGLVDDETDAYVHDTGHNTEFGHKPDRTQRDVGQGPGSSTTATDTSPVKKSPTAVSMLE